MNDRELLEMAAKAAGIDGYFASDDQNERDEYWNPLDSDGDALRLAAKLQIDIESGAAYAQATWYDLNLSETHEVLEYFDYEEERLPTIRLCIVRAAAEIGKAMP